MARKLNIARVIIRLFLAVISFLFTYFMLTLFGVKNPWVAVCVNSVWYFILSVYGKNSRPRYTATSRYTRRHGSPDA